jgi:pimeloyl-ACP methyl ester carboxylesterase
MPTFVLIPGAGGAATWYWHRVVPLLRRAGHEAITVDLPAAGETAGLPEYARLVVGAIGDRLFPAGFQQRVARERLGREAGELGQGQPQGTRAEDAGRH